MTTVLLIWKNCNLSHLSSFHFVRPVVAPFMY
nr:MAG TPA: hypothetical protein [Caudoviricetes sp.]